MPAAPVGSLLQAGREASGLSVAEVAERTKIAEPLIGKIEQDDWSDCGGEFFARGHIRLIATAVGLDPRSVVERFDEVYGLPEPPPPWARPVRPPVTPRAGDAARPGPGSRPALPRVDLAPARAGRPGPSWRTAVVVALAIVAIGVAVFVVASLRGHDKQVAAPPDPSPSVVASASPPAGIELKLRVVPGQSSFVRVTNSAGLQLFAGTLSANMVKDFRDDEKLVVDYANAKAFTVTLNGKELGPPSCGAAACILQYEPA